MVLDYDGDFLLLLVILPFLFQLVALLPFFFQLNEVLEKVVNRRRRPSKEPTEVGQNITNMELNLKPRD